MFIHLSHVLNPNDGAFPGEPILTVEPDSVRSEEGKPFNSYMMHLPNHFATHMDGPHHFNSTGTNFADLPIEKFAYEGHEVLVVDLPHRNGPAEVVTKEDLEPYADALADKRLLLIRTGFEELKHTDPDTYTNRGVSLHPDLCKWLNEEFPKLDCLGMDWLSVASPTNDYGPEAHHWLLGNYTDHVICAIEDMALQALGDKKIRCVTLGPLRVAEVDSAPVNVMAWVED